MEGSKKVLRLFITAINLAVKCQNVGVRDNTWWSWLRLCLSRAHVFILATSKEEVVLVGNLLKMSAEHHLSSGRREELERSTPYLQEAATTATLAAGFPHPPLLCLKSIIQLRILSQCRVTLSRVPCAI